VVGSGVEELELDDEDRSGDDALVLISTLAGVAVASGVVCLDSGSLLSLSDETAAAQHQYF
jgi:hypothetical protein